MDVLVIAATTEAFACKAQKLVSESTVCCKPINLGVNALQDGLEPIVPL